MVEKMLLAREAYYRVKQLSRKLIVHESSIVLFEAVTHAGPAVPGRAVKSPVGSGFDRITVRADVFNFCGSAAEAMAFLMSPDEELVLDVEIAGVMVAFEDAECNEQVIVVGIVVSAESGGILEA